MADPTARTIHKTSPRGGTGAYKIANGVTLYEGALVGLVGGYLDFWDDGANSVFLGIVTGPALGISPGAALTGDTGATVVPEARVDISGETLMHLDSVGNITDETDQGDLVYSQFGNTDDMTTNATGRNHPIGYVERVRSTTDVDVTLFTPAEMLAQATA